MFNLQLSSTPNLDANPTTKPSMQTFNHTYEQTPNLNLFQNPTQ